MHSQETWRYTQHLVQGNTLLCDSRHGYKDKALEPITQFI